MCPRMLIFAVLAGLAASVIALTTVPRSLQVTRAQLEQPHRARRNPGSLHHPSPGSCPSGVYTSYHQCCKPQNIFYPRPHHKSCCEHGVTSNQHKKCCTTGVVNCRDQCCDSGVKYVDKGQDECCPAYQVYTLKAASSNEKACCIDGSVTDHGHICCRGQVANNKCCGTSDTTRGKTSCCPSHYPRSVQKFKTEHCCKASHYDLSSCIVAPR